MQHTLRFTALALAALLALPALGQAMPGKADKFSQMDTNKDEKVSQEEFKAFFPDMRDGAFITIDKDKSKSIERAEWDEFIKGHAAGMRPANMPGNGMGGQMPAGMEHMKGDMPHGEKGHMGGGMPMVTPPDGK